MKILRTKTVIFASVVALPLAGCGGVKLPPNTPQDLGDAFACVLTDVLTKQPVDDCIQKYGQAIVNDAVAMLVDSTQLASEQPAAHSFAMSLQPKAEAAPQPIKPTQK